MKEQMKRIAKENMVTLVFLVLCVFGFVASGQTFSYVLSGMAVYEIKVGHYHENGRCKSGICKCHRN